jgi:hypothetical protein
MGKVLDFLFGKDNNVFNKKGKVEHDLGQPKWTQWTHRFSENPKYDFTKHHGRDMKKADAPKK